MLSIMVWCFSTFLELLKHKNLSCSLFVDSATGHIQQPRAAWLRCDSEHHLRQHRWLLIAERLTVSVVDWIHCVECELVVHCVELWLKRASVYCSGVCIMVADHNQHFNQCIHFHQSCCQSNWRIFRGALLFVSGFFSIDEVITVFLP